MSIPPLFLAEIKNRCLSLLRQNAVHTLAHLNTSPTNSTEDDMDALDCLEEISCFFFKWASEIRLDKVSDDDAAAVTSYVAEYIGRCISRQRKYIGC